MKKGDFVYYDTDTGKGVFGIVLENVFNNRALVTLFSNDDPVWVPTQLLTPVPEKVAKGSLRPCIGQVVEINNAVRTMANARFVPENDKYVITEVSFDTVSIRSKNNSAKRYTVPWWACTCEQKHPCDMNRDYMSEQATSALKIGQFVRMNKPNTMPFKWHNVWVSSMDKYEGRIGVVCEKPDSSGIAVRFFDGEMPARYPCNALAQVSEAEARREYPLFLGNTVYLYEDIKDDFGTVLVKAHSPTIVKAFENELVEISRPGHDFVYRVPWWDLYTKKVTIENYWNPTKGQDVLVRENVKTNWMKAKLLDFQTVNIAVTDLGVFHQVMPLEGHEALQGTDNMPEQFVKTIVTTNI